MSAMKKLFFNLVAITVLLCPAIVLFAAYPTNPFSDTVAIADTVEIVIDKTNFPDTTFRQYVSEKADTDGNGSLSDEELNAVTSIFVTKMNISSLQGIEYFTSLKSLYCYENNLWSIDLSENTALEVVSCYSNYLSSLDLSALPSLKELNCSKNKLYTLKINGTSLEQLHCESNNLSEIDVSGYPKLTYFRCDSNGISKLDLTKNPALKYVYCANNLLTELDLSENVALDTLDCSNNDISSLDLKGYATLRVLNCTGNRLTELDLTDCIELNSLDCGDNDLTELILTGCSDLFSVTCYNNQLKTLDLSDSTRLTSLYCAKNKLFALDVSMCTNLTRLDCNSQKAEYAAPRNGDVWQLDLSALLTDWDKVRIINVTDGTLESDGKTVTFDGESAVVDYSYATGFGQRTVVISLTLSHGFRITVEGGIIDGIDGSSTSVAENETVTVTAQPPEGSVFEGWSVDGGETIISTEPTYTFTAASNTALKAVYSETPTTIPGTDDPPEGTDDPPTDPENPPSDPEGDAETPSVEPEGLSGGAIAGIVIGSVVGAVVIAYAVCAILFKKGIIKGVFLSRIYPFIK